MFFKNFFIGMFLIFSLNFCYSATNEKNIINQESTNESSLPQKKKNKHNTSISNDDTLQQSDNQQFSGDIKQYDNGKQPLTDDEATKFMKSLQTNIQRQQNAYRDMDYVYEREQKHTVQQEKLSRESLQEGIHDVRNVSEKEEAVDKVKHTEYKSHLFLGLHIGTTFTAVSNNVKVLPTLNLKMGFQNFLGIASKHIGLKIYADSVIASNIFESLNINSLIDFVDTTFTATNINAEVIFEMPISRHLRIGMGGGFGIGYMTYHDIYWDRLNGFASNLQLLAYISWKEKHSFEIGYKTFFYHYGSYVTRTLNVVNTPHSILSSDFARPMSLSIGWTYVF